eukprot:530561-Prymnesium_polylepis.1
MPRHRREATVMEAQMVFSELGQRLVGSRGDGEGDQLDEEEPGGGVAAIEPPAAPRQQPQQREVGKGEREQTAVGQPARGHLLPVQRVAPLRRFRRRAPERVRKPWRQRGRRL